MVAMSTLIQLLRWVLGLRGRVKGALKWLLGRLALYWVGSPSKSGPPAKGTLADNSPLTRYPNRNPGERIAKALEFEDDCIIRTDGEIIPLDHILPSIYPPSAGTSTQDSSLPLSIISPPNAPPNNIHSVSYAENVGDTHTNQSAHPRTSNNSSHSILALSPSGQSEHLSATSPALENEGSNQSPQNAAASSSRNDNNVLKTLDPETGNEVDHSAQTPPHMEINLDELPSRLRFVHMGNERIEPIMPEAIMRYEDRPLISKNGSVVISEIETLTMKYETHGTPEGWVKYNHPEGARYFFNPTLRIYVDANLHDETIRDHAMADIAHVKEFINQHNVQEIDDDTELVIQVRKDFDGGLLTSYYFVHHGLRNIFFLDKYRTELLSASWDIPGGATSESHLRHEIEAQYWFHCQLYPHSSTVTKAKIQELRDIVLHYIGDSTTAPGGSTSPYTLEELRNILGYTNDMDQNLGGVSVGAHSCLARFMFIFKFLGKARARFLNFHGEPHARLERTKSVYGGDIHGRTWLVKLLSLMPFCSPDFYLKSLQGLWVDGILLPSDFKESLETMNGDCEQIILLATVMLTANVAFLAIQSVDNIVSTRRRSATQIASYMSMITSIGSIVIGLLLSRHNRTKNHETLSKFKFHIFGRRPSGLGLEILAILYSLPYTLLMWSMIAFFLAIIFLCFLASDILTRSIVAVSCFFSVAFSLWCMVYVNWWKENTDGWDLCRMFLMKIRWRINSIIADLRR